MSKFTFSDRAEEDLTHHISYIISNDGYERASHIYDRIIEKIEILAETPMQLSVSRNYIYPELRMYTNKKLNVSVYFLAHPTHIEIIRLRSGGRNVDGLFNE